MSEMPMVTPDTRKDGDIRCFYCQANVGTPHAHECVKVVKKVRVRMVVEYEIEVPSHWQKFNVEFQRNEGSWCADNAIEELEALAAEKGCLCDEVQFEYLGDVSGPLRERV